MMVERTDPFLPGTPRAAGERLVGRLRSAAATLYVHAAVLDDVLVYGERELQREVGGFLLGAARWEPDATGAGKGPAGTIPMASSPAPARPVTCSPGLNCWVEIRHFLPAAETRSRGASLTFTHETWAQLHREVAARFPEDVVVGWQHTHPGLGVFLSGYDLFIHRHFFPQPWQVALVVDPVREEFAFFQWRGEQVVDCGFVCLAARPLAR